MADPSIRNLLCLRCGEEVTVDFTAPAPEGCPACGDTDGIPADLARTLTIRITEHELRILTIWASNWAHQIEGTAPAVIGTVIDRLVPQTPVPLSMAHEVADLARAFGEDNVSTHGVPGVPDAEGDAS